MSYSDLDMPSCEDSIMERVLMIITEILDRVLNRLKKEEPVKKGFKTRVAYINNERFSLCRFCYQNPPLCKPSFRDYSGKPGESRNVIACSSFREAIRDLEGQYRFEDKLISYGQCD